MTKTKAIKKQKSNIINLSSELTISDANED